MPTSRKQTLPPDTEIYYRSKRKSLISLVTGFAVFAGTLQYFMTPPPHNLFPSLFCGFFFLMGGYAVFCEVRFFTNPRAHCLKVAPEGLTLRLIGKPTLYRWHEIQEFFVHRREAGKKAELMGEPEVRFTLAETGKTVVIDDNYGWKPEDLAAHLNARRRKFKKFSKRD